MFELRVDIRRRRWIRALPIMDVDHLASFHPFGELLWRGKRAVAHIGPDMTFRVLAIETGIEIGGMLGGGSPASGGGGLGGMLGDVLGGALGGGQKAQPAASGLGGLASMLDMDGDGNPLDDIVAMAGKFAK